jgi:signal transduction histidine kinase
MAVSRRPRSKRGGAIELVVYDPGIGMSPTAIEIALSPFAQVANVHTRAHDGLGLRLTLVKRLATLHGLAFSIESPRQRHGLPTLRARAHLGPDCADAIPPAIDCGD